MARLAELLGQRLRIRILATSREALRISGETVWSVPSLAVPPLDQIATSGSALARALAGFDAVHLFVERAKLAQRTFAPTGENARYVALVCARLEGMPLAIELAAARTNAMSVEQIAERLQDRVGRPAPLGQPGLLTGGGRTSQHRQRTLRSTLDWSHNLVNETEHFLLRRLSVFSGGWILSAAESVCAENRITQERILDSLTLLVGKPLIMFEEGETDIGARYRLLETIRQYAAERLDASGEAEIIRTKHQAYFVALAEEAEPRLKGPPAGASGCVG